MPIQSCSISGRQGYKYGKSGKCYTYSTGNTQSQVRARNRAEKQGRAIEASKRARKA